MAAVFADRLAAVARFDARVYAHTAAQGALTGEAALAVLAVAAAHTGAAWPVAGLAEALMAGVGWTLFWLAWVAVVWAGLQVFGPPTPFDAVFRALGYAALPFTLLLFGQIAFLGPVATLVAFGLGLASVATAIQRVADGEALAAWALCLVGAVLARGAVALLT